MKFYIGQPVFLYIYTRHQWWLGVVITDLGDDWYNVRVEVPDSDKVWDQRSSPHRMRDVDTHVALTLTR